MGVTSASRDLNNLGEQLGTAAKSVAAAATQAIDRAQSAEPELRQRARLLGSQAEELGRLSRRRVDNSTRSVELQQSAESSRAAISVSQAAFIIFLTGALALITGYHGSIIAIGILVLMVVYKPFSASVRWQALLNRAYRT